jgi:hypothetical protein
MERTKFVTEPALSHLVEAIDEGTQDVIDTKLNSLSPDAGLNVEAIVSFEITYHDPSTKETHRLVVAESISVGRRPSNDGLILCSGVQDQTISADAALIVEKEGQVVVRNTSRFAPIDVQRSSGPMKLEPREELKLVGNATVIVPGRIFRHEIVVGLTETFVEGTYAGGTEAFVPIDYKLPAERIEVLAHLCAPIFYPDRFSARQTSTDISARIKRHGKSVTPKEVNNKIQRTKDSIEEKCLTELDNRDELALFLVTHKLITRQDILDFVIKE